ncbi:MAG: ribulose-phosphate 3-epimerase [Erysipelotrichaceae bacterium]
MIVAPSILSLDYSQFDKQMDILNHSKAKWLHFDVMDGHFVPNLTFGPDILKGMKKVSSLFMDVHIMVEDPFFFAPIFIDAGADMITFHYEAVKENQIDELIDLIHRKKAKAGISIKPNTSVEKIKPYLKNIDLVLVMSVEPGFGGQSFIEDSLLKISSLAQWKKELDLNYLVEVDGGINEKTAVKVKEAGVNVVVAGSFVFKGDIEHNINLLL